MRAPDVAAPPGDTGIADLLAQMSRGASVLNGWDMVLNIDAAIVNQIFAARFAMADSAAWQTITIAYCQLFPSETGQLALYTRVDIAMATPALTLPGDKPGFASVTFQISGRAGTAVKPVTAGFDPIKDADPTDPTLRWTDKDFSATALTGIIPLSAIAGDPQADGTITQFVLDFPAGQFVSPMFELVPHPDRLQLEFRQYLVTHDVRVPICAIRSDLANQTPQVAPRSFRLATLTTNAQRTLFQIFVASQNPAPANLTIGVNEPVPDGYELSALFNTAIVKDLGLGLMPQTWLFLETNLVFPGTTDLALGPEYTPDDALILGRLAIRSGADPVPPSPVKPSPVPPDKDTPMLDIQNTRQITVAGQASFTAYGDDADANAWYIVPKAVWARDPVSGLPQFALVQYNRDGGAQSGFCRFSVELAVDPAQEQALLATIGGARLAQFDWIASAAMFTYTVNGKTSSVAAQPSGFGTQMVTFSIPLPDAASLNAFVNAFSPTGSQAGTFGVSFDLTADTRLPAVTVVTNFDSTIAYQYQVEQRYAIQTQYHTDTWGHHYSDQVSVYVGTFVHEMMKQSQAASVTITPGQGLTPTLLSMVTDWAHVQLEKDVEQAVNTALMLIKNPTADFSLTNVSSFTHTLTTSNVVPWYFTVDGTLPPFDAVTWTRLHSVVDQRTLDVAFVLQQDLAKRGIARVNLDVKYGTTSLAHSFAPGQATPYMVQLDGLLKGQEFDPGYQYRYDVIYADPVAGDQPLPPLSTDWIATEAPVVTFGDVELGLLAVRFAASNIAWTPTTGHGAAGDTPTVDEIAVEWNWIPDGTGPVLADTFTLNQATPQYTATLRSTHPTQNQEYRYSLTFLMSDGTKVHANNLRDNTTLLRIDAPLSTVSVSVLPNLPSTAKAVVLRATFDDEMNDIHLNKQWQVRAGKTQGDMADLDFASWDFQAIVANLNNAVVVFSGFWIDGKGKQQPIPSQILIGSNNTIFISDTQFVATATIDASQVAFVPPRTDGVYRVVALVADAEAPLASDANPLANARTLEFAQNTPSTLYYQTDPIDIGKTPTFYFQYVYTAIAGTTATETNAWSTPQKTISTALPVIAALPPATPRATALGADAANAGLLGKAPVDPRTQRLLGLHDRFCDEVPVDLVALGAS